MMGNHRFELLACCLGKLRNRHPLPLRQGSAQRNYKAIDCQHTYKAALLGFPVRAMALSPLGHNKPSFPILALALPAFPIFAQLLKPLPHHWQRMQALLSGLTWRLALLLIPRNSCLQILFPEH